MRAFLLAITIFASGCSPCNSPTQTLWATTCRNLNFNFTKTKLTPSASCAGVSNSVRPQINCAPGSGSFHLCSSFSNGSSYYIVLVPNTGGGIFQDSTFPTPITNCGDLWNALTQVTPPSDITAVFYSNGGVGEVVSCTDSGGCTASPSTCFSSWNAKTGQPTGSAASIPTSKDILSCAFIDAAGAGPPPSFGYISNSTSTSFQEFTSIVSPLLFSTWGDYE